MNLKERKAQAKREYLMTHPNSLAMNVVPVLTEDGIKINDFTLVKPCLPFKGRHVISSLKPSL